jgi:hypothetical protein
VERCFNCLLVYFYFSLGDLLFKPPFLKFGKGVILFLEQHPPELLIPTYLKAGGAGSNLRLKNPFWFHQRQTRLFLNLRQAGLPLIFSIDFPFEGVKPWKSGEKFRYFCQDQRDYFVIPLARDSS